jgi:xanthine dehydrogenase/oxidase
MSSSGILCFINGKRYDICLGDYTPNTSLLSFLRKKVGLTGTKLGCGEGACGSCTVMISKYELGRIQHFSVNACLFPLFALDGFAVTTIEGIGGMKERLHPIQKRIASLNGSQCGFCTPGIIMALYTQLRNKPDSSPQEIEESLDGNLCRCTGYRPILDGAKSLSTDRTGGCCRGNGGSCPCKDDNSGNEVSSPSSVIHSDTLSFIASLPSLHDDCIRNSYTEPIFPPALMKYQKKNVAFSNDSFSWFQPLELEELLLQKQKNTDAKLVVGNTEVSLEMRLRGIEYKTFINPTAVPQLTSVDFRSVATNTSEAGLTIGAAVTLNYLRDYLKTLFLEHSSSYQLRGFKALYSMMNWFASNHIRNVASIGGNIITASPIADLNPILLSCNAMLKISSVNGNRIVPIREFFLSYRKVNLQSSEILESIFIPVFQNEFDFLVPFKQSKRREDDISIVVSGMRFTLDRVSSDTISSLSSVSSTSTSSGSTDSSSSSVEPVAVPLRWIIRDAVLAFGGMGPTSLIAEKTCRFLRNKEWSQQTFLSAYQVLNDELTLPEDVPGGQPIYRMTLALSFLFKTFLLISNDLGIAPVEGISGQIKNFLTDEKSCSRGEQTYYTHNDSFPNNHPSSSVIPSTRNIVGQPIPNKNSESQCCGDAKYTGDIPLPPNACYIALVMSTIPHGLIKSIDISEAEKCSGFIRFLSAKDIPGVNAVGTAIKDEEVFVTKEVKCVGAIIGVIIADSHEQAVYASKKVKIDYEILPAIITIDEAIEANSFYTAVHHSICHGNLEEEKAKSDIHIKDTLYIGGQEHFYLEPNCSIAIPSDNRTLEIYSSAQSL